MGNTCMTKRSVEGSDAPASSDSLFVHPKYPTPRRPPRAAALKAAIADSDACLDEPEPIYRPLAIAAPPGGWPRLPKTSTPALPPSRSCDEAGVTSQLLAKPEAVCERDPERVLTAMEADPHRLRDADASLRGDESFMLRVLERF
eukprot:SAG11_NODE_19229_length_471_cov_1.112903_1_plen_144_part_10